MFNNLPLGIYYNILHGRSGPISVVGGDRRRDKLLLSVIVGLKWKGSFEIAQGSVFVSQFEIFRWIFKTLNDCFQLTTVLLQNDEKKKKTKITHLPR